MERILQKLTSMESDIKNIREDVKELKNRNEQEEVRDCASVPANGNQRTNGYRENRNRIPNPVSNRSSKSSSFVSVGKVLYAWIEQHNNSLEPSAGGVPVLQIETSNSSYTRQAMHAVAQVLGESAVFRRYLGFRTLKEIKSAYARTPNVFQVALSEVTTKVIKIIPELQLTCGGWGAYELIKGKLVNMKEEQKKSQQLFESDFEDSEYMESTEEIEEVRYGIKDVPIPGKKNTKTLPKTLNAPRTHKKKPVIEAEEETESSYYGSSDDEICDGAERTEYGLSKSELNDVVAKVDKIRQRRSEAQQRTKKRAAGRSAEEDVSRRGQKRVKPNANRAEPKDKKRRKKYT